MRSYWDSNAKLLTRLILILKNAIRFLSKFCMVVFCKFFTFKINFVFIAQSRIKGDRATMAPDLLPNGCSSHLVKFYSSFPPPPAPRSRWTKIFLYNFGNFTKIGFGPLSCLIRAKALFSTTKECSNQIILKIFMANEDKKYTAISLFSKLSKFMLG